LLRISSENEPTLPAMDFVRFHTLSARISDKKRWPAGENMSENERKEIAEVVQALGALDDGAK
jgi:hypothetical protein